MIWPRPPSSETAWAEAQRNKRINRIGSLLFFIPLLTCFVLFLSFNIYWFHAPWEIAYRHHGAAVLRAQIEALPIYNTDRPARFTSYSDDRLIVSVDFPRNEPCAPISNITSKSLQPTAGPMREWTMILLISTSELSRATTSNYRCIATRPIQDSTSVRATTFRCAFGVAQPTPVAGRRRVVRHSTF